MKSRVIKMKKQFYFSAIYTKTGFYLGMGSQQEGLWEGSTPHGVVVQPKGEVDGRCSVKNSGLNQSQKRFGVRHG